MVRLKGQGKDEVVVAGPNFNSKVVRLKEPPFVGQVAAFCKFQFQSGAVKSSTLFVSAMSRRNISIPKWCG